MRWPSSGQVGDVPFARIFGALATERYSGRLKLEHEKRVYSVTFAGGEIMDAESSAPEDTVGRVALDAGLIDANAVGESIRRMAKNGKLSQLETLVDMGAVTADDGARLGRLALTRRALRAFALPTASYALEEQAGDGEGGGGPLEARWILYRGLRQHYDERRLDKELTDLADKAIKLPGDENVFAPFGFSDEERIVAAYLQKGYWETFDLVDACMTLPRAAVHAVVLSLYAAGALDVQLATSVPRLRKRVREATVRLSRDVLPPNIANQSLTPPTTPPAAAKPPQTISQQMRAITIPSDMPSKPATVPPFMTQKAGTLPPGMTAKVPTPPGGIPPKPGTIPPKPGTIPPVAAAKPPTIPPGQLDGVIPAGGVVQSIKEQITAKLAQVEGGANHFVILELDKSASSSQVKNAYFQLAKTYHPDRLALVKLEALRPQVERIFARLSDAYATIGDDARRNEYLKILSEGGEAAVKKRNDEEAARATRVLTAEEHFRKGEMALRRELFGLAEQEFQAAVELNDAEPEHHALLAWSRWCGASDKEAVWPEVKKMLAKATELSDRCLPAFLAYGQIYIQRGEHDRAYMNFQRVLDLNSDHVEAKRQVRLIEMRRAKAGEKKGLFDMFKKK